MRGIECPCGHHLEGADDEELFRLAREHVDSDHPDMRRTDEQLRGRIAADAYDLAAGHGMITQTPVDVDVLRDEIHKTYTEVSTDPGKDFIFPTGRAWAEVLGYPQLELAHVPDATVESFAGVANPFALGRPEPGRTVLDLGCGAGTDLLIAAQMVGPEGRVIGIDMTESMLERAGASAESIGLDVELHQGLIEDLPLPDESVDIVMSNGVIDLVPDKDAVFGEMDRVLRPGGRVQIADVVIHTEVSEDARTRIDLWTG
jgi:2-polyprenyl-3-methyl-5-hydroxy-6-metoxy-1,4-benzoquinol methylase